MAERVRRETGLLPHLNPGVLTFSEYQRLRAVAPSMGLMLESASDRLCTRGGPHFGSPDKDPATRLASIRDAGKARVPLTSGLLIGIGETRAERIESLRALKDLHDEYGHLQELIIQNFVPKPGTKMAGAEAPPFDELRWTIAVARILFGAQMSVQVPPNLNEGRLAQLVDAGINDWGGVSPLTPDHVNPESPWPHLQDLEAQTKQSGKQLIERLTVYPRYIRDRAEWIAGPLHGAVLNHSDGDGLARDTSAVGWAAGRQGADVSDVVPRGPAARPSKGLDRLLEKVDRQVPLEPDEVVRLFRVRGDEFHRVVQAANELRQERCGERVTYVVNRNINYTNVCEYKCTFCAFSKGKTAEHLRGRPYLVDLDEIGRRVEEAWRRGATEICLQGGIHPRFTGQTYLDICRAVREAAPDIHIHAFSPLEVAQGAATLGWSVDRFLVALKQAGLNSLPGTAAEILDDRVRAVICPDKLKSQEWLDVMATAHELGLPTTATIMFGHMEGLESWALHLIRLRQLQAQTGGFTEFVPLPFVHMEAPMFLRGGARPGPTPREAVLMHAVARLALDPGITNIQVSWPKLGPEFAKAILDAGANDLGGTLMNESISRAAGAAFGQELPAAAMRQLILGAGRDPVQRNTRYQAVPSALAERSLNPPPMTEPINRSLRDYGDGPLLARSDSLPATAPTAATTASRGATATTSRR